jgi:hypothetical protein
MYGEREVLHGVVNHLSEDGMEGVAGSIPAGMHTAAWAGSPGSEGCQTDVWCDHWDLAVHAEDGMAARRQWSDLSGRTRRLLAITAVAEGILKLAALIDLKRRPASQVRGPKWVWATVVTVVSSAGVVPVSYFLFGRRQLDRSPTDLRDSTEAESGPEADTRREQPTLFRPGASAAAHLIDRAFLPAVTIRLHLIAELAGRACYGSWRAAPTARSPDR